MRAHRLSLRPHVQAARHAAALSVVLLLHAAAHAGIASKSNNVAVISRPQGTLVSNNIESNSQVFVWFERLIVNPGNQSLNHVGAGTVSNGGPFGTNRPSPATVAPPLAESFLVHFDPQNGVNGNSAAVSNAVITFDREIIGIWHTSTGLYGSDAQWGPGGLTYAANNSTGLVARPYELGGGSTSDRYQISSDRKTITILNTYEANNGVDQLRILVNPEPSSWALMGLGLAGLGALVLRRRRSSAPVTNAQS